MAWAVRVFMPALCGAAGFPMAALPGARASMTDLSCKGTAMSDVIFLALAVTSFAGLILYTFFCERQ
jgi:hypothetical protein